MNGANASGDMRSTAGEARSPSEPAASPRGERRRVSGERFVSARQRALRVAPRVDAQSVDAQAGGFEIRLERLVEGVVRREHVPAALAEEHGALGDAQVEHALAVEPRGRAAERAAAITVTRRHRSTRTAREAAPTGDHAVRAPDHTSCAAGASRYDHGVLAVVDALRRGRQQIHTRRRTAVPRPLSRSPPGRVAVEHAPPCP